MGKQAKKRPHTVAVYRPHYREHAAGHIYIDKAGACTISLEGAAAMSQAELDLYGHVMAAALASMTPSQWREVGDVMRQTKRNPNNTRTQ